MPVKWTPEMEREMLLIAVGDLRPSPTTWEVVAEKLGRGLNANAVSQKFYKLKREAEALAGGAPTTPAATKTAAENTSTKTPASKSTTGRKRKSNAEDLEETPTKRGKVKAAAEDDEDHSGSVKKKNGVKAENTEDEEKGNA